MGGPVIGSRLLRSELNAGTETRAGELAPHGIERSQGSDPLATQRYQFDSDHRDDFHEDQLVSYIDTFSLPP